MNNLDIKVYVINLRRSVDRHKHMQSQFKRTGIKYEFVDAVDAVDLSKDEIDLINKNRTYFQDLRPTEIACSLSHIKAMRKAIEDDVYPVIIVEDDILVSRDLGSILTQLTLYLNDGDVITLSNVIVNSINFIHHSNFYESYSLYTSHPIDNLFGAQAYVMTPKTAKNLVEFLDPIKSIADDWARIVNEGPVENIKIVFPFPVQHGEFLSVINKNNSSNTSLRTKIKNFLYANQVLIFYQFFLYMRRRKILKKYQNFISINGNKAKKIYILK